MKSAITERSVMKRLPKTWLFLAAVLLGYAVLFIIDSDQASAAIKSSGHVFRNIAWPMGLVFFAMLAINIFVKPAQIVRFLGKNAGLKGMFIATLAGIISVGPIYAWYPLLKDLREKGAGNFPITLFLCNRAVKPFLLPMMVAIFGWEYVVILTILTVMASFIIAYLLSFVVKEEPNAKAG
ncbi:MAG: permease [Chloroflexi bacterium]|nr:permease [Chloroflexota bacterium]